MGIPVSGKNLFPSNIEGLPTWFTIRGSKHGWIARRKEIYFLVAMNPETAEEDVRALDPGAACVYDEKLGLKNVRDDLKTVGVYAWLGIDGNKEIKLTGKIVEFDKCVKRIDREADVALD